jgi:hypothetical protein
MADHRILQAIELMTRFAARTGVHVDGPARRYLWTDAFATCNLLGLSHATGRAEYAELALRLVDRVHHTLGWYRADDPRTGWISGLAEREGEAHPTVGGLRIGKSLPERRPEEPLDERLEWDRDGQYFHYLTKWMHALDQVMRSTGLALFGQWARELAHAAHRAFTYEPRGGGGGKRMYWKMSIDLSRPLVGSMGQHDPLDGLVTCLQLDATIAARLSATAEPDLAGARADFGGMIGPRGLATDDPLGLGGLLVDAYRVEQIQRQGALAGDDRLFETLLAAAYVGLRHYAEGPALRGPAHHRLAFRELGLAIGLAAVGAMEEAGGAVARSTLGQLARYLPLRTEIEAFWLQAEHRRVATWLEHEDINDVMLATSLAPSGFLVLRPPS